MHPFGLGSRPQAAPVPNNSQQAPGIENLSTLLGSLSLSGTTSQTTQAQAAPALGGTNISLTEAYRILTNQLYGTGMQIWDSTTLQSCIEQFMQRIVQESMRQVAQHPAAYPETGNAPNLAPDDSAREA